MTLLELWTLCIFKRDKNICQKCGRPAVDAHHIIHKDSGFLRYHMGNGVALCRDCHNLDAQGRLKGWCMGFIGEDKYYALKQEAHHYHSGQKIFDEDAKREELKAFMESDPYSS